MPLYTYQCSSCSVKVDAFRRVDDRDNCPPCPECEAATFKAVTAASVQADYPGYACPITGTWIEGRRAHEENLARHGCRILETGETERIDRLRAAEEARSLKETTELVGEHISKMGSEERRQLETAVEHGFTCTTERR